MSQVPWFTSPPPATLERGPVDHPSLERLTFPSPEDGGLCSILVSRTVSEGGETWNSQHVWRLDVTGDSATVRPSIHFVDHFHSPNPVVFRLVGGPRPAAFELVPPPRKEPKLPSTRQNFANAVLTKAGLAETGANVDALVAAMTQENTSAQWNPLATTEPWEGATDLPGNSAGVKCYASMDDGVAATVATLTNGHYSSVLAELGQGTDADAVVRAWASSPWGTWEGDPDAASATLLTVEHNRPAYYGAEVDGPDASPPAPAPVPDNPEVNVNVPQLSLGSTGPAVKALQAIANEKFGCSPPLVVDGDYGPKTEAFVHSLEVSRSLSTEPDGHAVAGPQVWHVLLNES